MLSRVDGWLLSVEQTLLSIESAKHTTEVVSRLTAGAAALKELQSGLSLDAAEALVQETAEAAAYQQRLSELLQVPGALSEEADEAALAELEELEAMEADRETLEGAGVTARLPSVPKKERAAPGCETDAAPLEASSKGPGAGAGRDGLSASESDLRPRVHHSQMETVAAAGTSASIAAGRPAGSAPASSPAAGLGPQQSSHLENPLPA